MFDYTIFASHNDLPNFENLIAGSLRSKIKGR